MQDISTIGFIGAFIGGFISFMSPCTLPLIPGYLSFIAGQGQGNQKKNRSVSMFLSVFFVLGFSTIFILLGLSATALGGFVMQYRFEANLLGGILLIIFGVFMSGLINIQWLQHDMRVNVHLQGGSAGGAYLLGIAFAFGWTPCIGPILAAILTYSAVSTTPQTAALFLAVYSLGLAIPFLGAALCIDLFKGKMKMLSRYSHYLRMLAGWIMILMGVAMISGKLTIFSIWMLQMFPSIANLG